MRTLRSAAYISIGLSTLAAALFGWLFYDLFWRWRTRFDSEGRYFDDETMVVHHEQSGALVLPLALCVLWLCASLWFAFRRRPESD